MITSDNKARILSVVNIFETGTADGAYDDISIFADGKNNTRQITYGRSQTTEQGNLKKLIEAYIANKGMFAKGLKPYIPKIGIKPLVNDKAFIMLLKWAAKEDETMIKTQDQFFDKVYYQPALKYFTDNGFTQPLSMLVIYDSFIHSGSIMPFLTQRFAEKLPKMGGDEKAWIKAYVTTRQAWLLTKGEPLSKTVYRTKTFLKAMELEDWTLQLPLVANGVLSRSIGEKPTFTDLPFIVPIRGYNREGLTQP